jgi:RNA polymerase sigma-32 factor
MGDTVGQYSDTSAEKHKSKYLPLTVDQECNLARAWQQNGDIDARNRLVCQYMTLAEGRAAYFARKTSVPFEDLKNEILLSLIEATDRFNPELGVRFGTYANWWVQIGVNNCLGRANVVMSPTKRYKERKANGSLTCISLDAPIGNEDDGMTMLDAMACPTDYEALIENNIWRSEHRQRLERAMTGLTARERQVISMRYLERDYVPDLGTVGAALKISRERVRQIEARARAKILQRIKIQGWN